MLLTRSRLASALAILVTVGAGSACAQEYPSKAVHIFAGSLGSGNDFISRLIGPSLATQLGQPVVVENRGGGSAISGGIVGKAPPDGYTLIAASNSFWTAALLQKMPYDVARDFAAITLIGTSPLILVVHPSLPVKSVKDLIALAKARPGELNYASSGLGGSTHLAAELFNMMGGVKIARVSYSSAAATLNGVLTGEAPITFDTSNTLLGHIRSNKLRALAVTTAKPSALVPGVPTVSSSNLPGFEATQMNGIFVPAKTPQSITTRLNNDIVRILKRPEIKEKFISMGVEVIGSTPDQFATAVKEEIARLAKVIKDANIKAE